MESFYYQGLEERKKILEEEMIKMIEQLNEKNLTDIDFNKKLKSIKKDYQNRIRKLNNSLF